MNAPHLPFVKFDADFFKKHQRLILHVANSPLLRWVFGLDRLPKGVKAEAFEHGICKLAPGAIHWQLPDGSYKTACFTRHRFAEALAYSLSPLAYMIPRVQPNTPYRIAFSPMGALGLLLAACAPQLGMLAFGTTDTIYCGAGDGRIEASGTWATIRAATSGTAYPTGTGGFDIAAMVNYIDRTYWPADTSSIDDIAVASAASLFIYGDDGAGVNADTTTAELVHTSQASPTTLVNNDYDNLAFTSGGSKSFASWNGAGYNEIALNATGLTWLDFTGYTLLGVITGRDLSNTVPTGNNWMSCRYSEATGSSKDPYLSVTYSIPSSGVQSLVMIL